MITLGIKLLTLLPILALLVLVLLQMIKRPIWLVAAGIYAVSLDHIGRIQDSTFTINNLLKVALIAAVILHMMQVNRRIRIPRHLIWFLPFLAFTAISSFYSHDVARATFFLIRLCLLWTFALLVANVVESRRHLAILLVVMAGTAAVVSTLAHMQTLNALTLAGVAAFQKAGPDSGGVRAISTFWDANHMGGFLTVLTVFLVAFVADVKTRWSLRMATLVVVFLAFGAILLSFSRSAWLALGLSMLLFTRFSDMRKGLKGFYVVGVLGVGYLTFFTPYGRDLFTRLSSIANLGEDYSGNFRLYLAISGLEMWANGLNWIWGAGFQSFGRLIGEHWYFKASNDMIFHSGVHLSHTLWITLLAEGGLIAITLFILFMRSVLREASCLLSRRETGVFRAVAVACWVLMVVKLADFFLNPSIYDNQFWMTLGLLGALSSIESIPEKGGELKA